MKCLRRFILRCRGSHGSTSLHALRPVSPYFLRSARFLKNTNIWDRGALQPGIVGLSGTIFEASDLSHFCDAFGGERDILKLRGKAH